METPVIGSLQSMISINSRLYICFHVGDGVKIEDLEYVHVVKYLDFVSI